MPPPMKTETTRRPQIDGSADFEVGDQRVDVRGLGRLARASCELKSQYGHFLTHHGTCT